MRSPRATGPGLAGALLVGVSAAKAIALAADLPYVGVNHLEAHLYAARLEEPELEPPLAGAARVGWAHDGRGHGGPRAVPRRRSRRSTTRRGRRSTRSRATSGSATRAARDRPLAVERRSRRGAVPAGDAAASRNFSFAGLKTAVVNHVRHHPDYAVADVAASFQEAVVDQLVVKLLAAADEAGAPPSCSEEGWRRTRGCGPAWPPPPRRAGGGPSSRPGAVHRQRGDDRGGGLVAAPGRRADPARRRGGPQPRLPERDPPWYRDLALAAAEC